MKTDFSPTFEGQPLVTAQQFPYKKRHPDIHITRTRRRLNAAEGPQDHQEQYAFFGLV